MTNFSINFTNPWLLLLLIPAGLLTIIPYFRLNKRYRCTRNRIVSIVLHLIIMVLSISVLAGMTFDYDIPNTENEVMLVVDSSFSTEKSENDKDDFIRDVIDNSDSMFKLGIVTFGYDQVYAAELTNDTKSIYSAYAQSPMPDTTATDIAAALNFAAEKFSSPESARIVLVSDALETDGNVKSVIKSIAAKGIKVDTVYFSEDISESEVQLIDLARPEEKIKVGEKFDLTLTVQSSYIGTALITPYDEGSAGMPVEVDLVMGTQQVVIPYEFAMPGLHRISFEIESANDTLTQNNEFHSYIYLEVFDDLLVIESNDTESEELCKVLRDELNVTVVNVADEEKMPKTLNELRAFDEVILVNIANSDMPAGFDKLLQSYVSEVGGGLFTICGNEQDTDPGDDEWTANAYTRNDMYGTVYQDMLPVEVINYTPPVAVMILIDRSGSMYDPSSGAPEETSKLGAAKLGAEACLDALTERDYVGIMSLGDDYDEEIELTPRPQRDKILAAIDKIEGGGGTIFSSALKRAGQALSALNTVERRHIIIVTDGEPSSEDEADYEYWLEENAKLGITVSIVGIQCSISAQNKMISALEDHAGCPADNFHDAQDIQSVPTIMREDLMVPEIKDVNYATFQPTISGNTAITNGILQENVPNLDGFYGVKAKPDATVVLMGDYTPIYTQWQYGMGTVGTFACDLNGTWSGEFLSTDAGITIINNIIVSLFPTESIKPKDVQATVSGSNYTTQLNVFTDLLENEYIEVIITEPGAEGEIKTITAGPNDSYSRLSFAAKVPGVHIVEVRKMATDEFGTASVVASTTVYKALSYSQEYNAFRDQDAAYSLIQTIAASADGTLITEGWQVFENSVKYLHRSIDPRIAFMIIALVLFLLDIAVRKFKWKWPHEIINDRKARAAMANNK